MLPIAGCSCAQSHGLDDAGSDAPIPPDVPPDAPVVRVDAPGPLCVIDDAIPPDAMGCCYRQGQRCTDSCGSFVSYCDPSGCCVYTGP